MNEIVDLSNCFTGLRKLVGNVYPKHESLLDAYFLSYLQQMILDPKLLGEHLAWLEHNSTSMEPLSCEEVDQAVTLGLRGFDEAKLLQLALSPDSINRVRNAVLTHEFPEAWVEFIIELTDRVRAVPGSSQSDLKKPDLQRFDRDDDSANSGRMFTDREPFTICLNAVQKTSHLMVFAKKLDEHDRIVFTFVNDAFARLFGKSPDDVVGLTDEELGLRANEICGFREADEAILHGKETNQIVGRENVTLPNGNVVVLQTRKEALRLPNGELLMLGVAPNITDQIIFENRVHVARSMITAVINAYPLSIWIKGLDGRYIETNDHFAKWHSTSPDKMKGRTDADYWPQHIVNRFHEDDDFVIASGKPNCDYVRKIKWLDDSDYSILMTKSPVFDSNNKVIALIGMCDVLEHSRTGQRIFKAKRSDCSIRLSQSHVALKTLASSNELWSNTTESLIASAK